MTKSPAACGEVEAEGSGDPTVGQPDSQQPDRRKVINMQPIVEKVDGVAVVTVPLDELEISSVDEFKLQMTRIMEDSNRLVLDLTRVGFIDSSGCGAIIFCLKRLAESGGDLKLCGVTKPVATVLQLIRLNRICDILETRDEAIKAFES